MVLVGNHSPRAHPVKVLSCVLRADVGVGAWRRWPRFRGTQIMIGYFRIIEFRRAE
jgi:hypothetical protein